MPTRTKRALCMQLEPRELGIPERSAKHKPYAGLSVILLQGAASLPGNE